VTDGPGRQSNGVAAGLAGPTAPAAGRAAPAAGRAAVVALIVALIAAACSSTVSAARPPATLAGGLPGAAKAGRSINQIDWDTVTVPGSVCLGQQSIQLRPGGVTIPAPAAVKAGTPDVLVQQFGAVYGDLYGTDQDVAVLSVWCLNPAGATAGQLRQSLVVFAVDNGSPQSIAVLAPQQPPGPPAAHVPYFTGTPIVTPGEITVREVWYGPGDPTCCPSIRVRTVWSYAAGRFTPASTRLS
jgi:hypothetical protein